MQYRKKCVWNNSQRLLLYTTNLPDTISFVTTTKIEETSCFILNIVNPILFFALDNYSSTEL